MKMFHKKDNVSDHKQRVALIAAICAFVMVSTLVLSFILSSNMFHTRESTISLPTAEQRTEIPDMSFILENQKKIEEIQISAENVQAVIASLNRPISYQAQIRNTLYWEDGEGTLQTKQSVKREAYRTERLDASGHVQEVQLQYHDKLYVWGAGSDNYYSGAAGDLIADETAMLPDYKTVCQLPTESIISATLEDNLQQPMISVVAQTGNRTTEYWISATTGLLCQSIVQQNGKVIQKIEVQTTITEISDALFTLPGKTTAVFQTG